MHKDCDKRFFKKPEFYRLTGGNNYVRIDAEDKVTGRGKYAGDFYLPGMLTAKMVRSTHAHAKILSIDTSEAEKLPGVKAVLTAKDFKWPGKLGNAEFAVEFADREVLVTDKVRRIGDDIAAVAAIDEETAQKAVDLIKVEYEDIPAVFDPFEAMEDGAPWVNGAPDTHNVGMATFRKGGTDPDEEFANAAFVYKEDYETHRMVHAAIEPHAATANYENGVYTIWMSTQLCFVDQYWYSHAMGVDPEKIRVIKPLVGGGFGGKMDSYSFGIVAAKLSEMTSRPVRMVLTREEVFQMCANRHPIYVHVETAHDKDGRLLAKRARHILDGGPYGGTGVAACAQSTIWACLPYKMRSVDVEARRVYTNNPHAGAMRGYTSCQIHFCHDVHMQLASEAMGIDPVDFRRMSVADPGYETPSGIKVTSCASKQCLDTVRKEIHWDERKDNLADGEGIGFAASGFVSGTGFPILDTPNRSSASVVVKINKLGHVTVYTGANDIGMGSDTAMTAIVAEELGLTLENTTTVVSDTHITPFDSGSYGSRVTFLSGNAARRAAVDAKQKLFEVIGPMWGVMPHTLECLEGKVISKQRADLQMPFRDAVFKWMAINGGDELTGVGSYSHEGTTAQYNSTADDSKENFAPAYSFSASAAHVTVDKETGCIDIDDFVFAHDCGRALNRRAVEGQLEGSIGMGVGYTCFEHNITKDGKILNPNFRDYRFPTALDMPKMRTYYDFPADEEGPFGAKECGEGSAAPVAPAIANAIHSATGIKITKLPLDPEHIWRMLNGMEDDRHSK